MGIGTTLLTDGIFRALKGTGFPPADWGKWFGENKGMLFCATSLAILGALVSNNFLVLSMGIALGGLTGAALDGRFGSVFAKAPAAAPHIPAAGKRQVRADGSVGDSRCRECSENTPRKELTKVMEETGGRHKTLASGQSAHRLDFIQSSITHALSGSAPLTPPLPQGSAMNPKV
ncbi:MAG: hypothetical protein JO089_08600 [Alphaproteobacteria bacterium]|nr:hypothetical protein [Alphaproteobacteria bacterium]